MSYFAKPGTREMCPVKVVSMQELSFPTDEKSTKTNSSAKGYVSSNLKLPSYANLFECWLSHSLPCYKAPAATEGITYENKLNFGFCSRQSDSSSPRCASL
jgi:hypothetical protein